MDGPAELWVHQRDALEQARKRRRLLAAHACGLGKTKTGVEFLREAQAAPDAPQLSLIVAPLAAHSVWRQHIHEAELTSDLCLLQNATAARPQGRAVVLCGYEMLRRAFAQGWKKDKPMNVEERPGELRKRRAWRRDGGHWLLDGPFSAVVADEIQEARVATSDRSQALMVACTATSHALGLSGTPVNRDMEELRSLLKALAIPKLERDKHPLAYVHQATKTPSVQEATKESSLYELDEMPPETIQKYNQQLVEAEHALSANEPMTRVHRSLQRLELVAVHPVLLDRSLASRVYSDNDSLCIRKEGSPHLRQVLSAIHKAASTGNRLIVVTAPQTHILRATADFLAPRLPHTHYWYTGAVSEQQRESVRTAFVAEDGQAILFLSQKAGGHALSLLPAAVIVFVGIWFTHISHDQTIGRLCRHGQTCKVQVFYVGARHGLTEAVLRAQQEDRTRAQAILCGEGSELLPAAVRRIVGECARAPIGEPTRPAPDTPN